MDSFPVKKEQSTAVFILELDSQTSECDVTRGKRYQADECSNGCLEILQNAEKTRMRLILLKTIGWCDKFQTKGATTKNERCMI